MLAKITNNIVEKFPYTIMDLFNEYRNVSFPVGVETDSDLLSQYGVYIVTQLPEPVVDMYKNVKEGPIVMQDGSWVKSWIVEDASNEEIEFRIQRIRGAAITRRDAELNRSDWTQFNDVPLTTEKKQEFAVYRQALRDITQQPGFPETITWPDPPTT